MPPKDKKRQEGDNRNVSTTPSDAPGNTGYGLLANQVAPTSFQRFVAMVSTICRAPFAAALPQTPSRYHHRAHALSAADMVPDRLDLKLGKRISVKWHDPVVQLDAHIAELLKLRGCDLSQRELPFAGVCGVSGSGKTVLLQHLCETWDTFATPDGQFRGEAHEHLRRLNNRIPDSSSQLSHFVVLYATYGQGGITIFCPARDTVESTQQRLMYRLAYDYYGDGRLANGYETVMNLARMSGGMRGHLLNHLAAVQQAELQDSLPTIMLVSSYHLWPVLEEYLTGPNRLMSILNLPMLPTVEVKDVLVDAFRSSNRSTTNLVLWENFVTATLDATGGHPRILEGAYVHLQECAKHDDPTRWTRRLVPESHEIASAVWTHVLAKQIATHTPVRISADALADTTAPLYDLTVMYVYVMTLPVRAVSRNPADFQLDLGVIPDYFFGCLGEEFWRYPTPFHRQWVSALDEAVWTLSGESAYKTWTQGMVAALALTAKAHLDINNGKAPTLKELLPGALFTHNELKDWRMDVSQRREFVCAATAAEMWRCADDDEPDVPEVFHRYAENPQQEVVEGSVELLMPDGQRAVGWTKNMLFDNSAQPGVVPTWVNSVSDFHKTNFPSAGNGCAIVFCAGNAKRVFRQLQALGARSKIPVPVVLIGSRCCEELLAPFGASVLWKKIEHHLRCRD